METALQEMVACHLLSAPATVISREVSKYDGRCLQCLQGVDLSENRQSAGAIKKKKKSSVFSIQFYSFTKDNKNSRYSPMALASRGG